MDFIEVSSASCPTESGMLELLLFVVPIVAIIAIAQFTC